MNPRAGAGERVAVAALFAAGWVALGGGLFLSTAFVLRHLGVPDGAIDGKTLGLLPLLRGAAIGVGSLLLGASAWAVWRPAAARRLLVAVPLPLGTLGAVIAVFCALAAIHAALRISGWETGASFFFPVAVFQPQVHWNGVPYLFGFLALLLALLLLPLPRGSGPIWLAGLGLIILGNLIQGGFVAGFHRPFTLGQIEYYHDALAITDGLAWLGDFNQDQPDLLPHSKTHPPFAVLLHHVVLAAGGGLTSLTLVFTLLASAGIPLVYAMLRELGLEQGATAQLALLMAVLPAVNIYGVVTLDAVIAAAAALCVYGMILITRSRKLALGIPLFVMGWLAASALTFGSVFLCALSALLALIEWKRFRRRGMLAAILVTSSVAVALWLWLAQRYGYDHFRAFVTASRLENPQGFLGWVDPLRYLTTRAECLLEIALFFSLGALAVVVHGYSRGVKSNERELTGSLYFLAATAILIGTFLSGAYKSGETARACLFIYPFLLFALMKETPRTLRAITLCAGVQTALMQWLGDFHW